MTRRLSTAKMSASTDSRQTQEPSAGVETSEYVRQLRVQQNRYLARMAPLWAQAHPYARRVLRERGLDS